MAALAETIIDNFSLEMSKSNKKFILESSLNLMTGVLVVITAVLIASTIVASPESVINKEAIHSKIIKASKNGASLEDIKQIYINAEEKRRNDISIVLEALLRNEKLERLERTENNEAYYKKSISLSEILKNIKADLFLKDKTDPELIELISKKIDEHEQSNPFDRLEPGQKIHFEIIQTKLGNNYSTVQSNINSIVDEIDNKKSTG